jgi:hypothetical protein
MFTLNVVNFIEMLYAHALEHGGVEYVEESQYYTIWRYMGWTVVHCNVIFLDSITFENHTWKYGEFEDSKDGRYVEAQFCASFEELLA